jgi:hypothetical protein
VLGLKKKYGLRKENDSRSSGIRNRPDLPVFAVNGDKPFRSIQLRGTEGRVTFAPRMGFPVSASAILPMAPGA